MLNGSEGKIVCFFLLSNKAPKDKRLDEWKSYDHLLHRGDRYN